MNDQLSSDAQIALLDELELRCAQLLDDMRALASTQAEAQQALYADGRAAEDSGDASAERTQLELLALQERDLGAELADVEHALSKFERGTYGLCEKCGEPIPLARLMILPEARYDAKHAAEIEAHPRVGVTLSSSVGGKR